MYNNTNISENIIANELYSPILTIKIIKISIESALHSCRVGTHFVRDGAVQCALECNVVFGNETRLCKRGAYCIYVFVLCSYAIRL